MRTDQRSPPQIKLTLNSFRQLRQLGHRPLLRDPLWYPEGIAASSEGVPACRLARLGGYEHFTAPMSRGQRARDGAAEPQPGRTSRPAAPGANTPKCARTSPVMAQALACPAAGRE